MAAQAELNWHYRQQNHFTFWEEGWQNLYQTFASVKQRTRLPPLFYQMQTHLCDIF